MVRMIQRKQFRISKLRCISVLKIVFISANSEDFDEMPQNVAFHPSLHCVVLKYLFLLVSSLQWVNLFNTLWVLIRMVFKNYGDKNEKLEE